MIELHNVKLVDYIYEHVFVYINYFWRNHISRYNLKCYIRIVHALSADRICYNPCSRSFCGWLSRICIISAQDLRVISVVRNLQKSADHICTTSACHFCYKKLTEIYRSYSNKIYKISARYICWKNLMSLCSRTLRDCLQTAVTGRICYKIAQFLYQVSANSLFASTMHESLSSLPANCQHDWIGNNLLHIWLNSAAINCTRILSCRKCY